MQWKAVNISAPYKSDDETDKHNYRPISLLKCARKIDGGYGGVNYYHACPRTGTWEPSPVGVWHNSSFHSALNEFPGHFLPISTSKEALYKKVVLLSVSIKSSIFPTYYRRISRTVLRAITLLASVSSHGDDGKEKIWKRLAGLIRKIKTLNMQHIFWQISLPSVRD